MGGSSSDQVSDWVAQRVPADRGAITLREWIVLLAVALVSIVFLWAATYIPPTSPWPVLVTAVGTGLLVSAVFSFVQRMVTGKVERRAQARYLADLAETLSGEFRQQVAQVRSDAATHDFPGSATPDPRFNEVLMRDLRGAPAYWFRGYSARYVAARLRLGTATSCQVRVILPDPRAEDSLNLRLSYLSRAGRDAPDDETVREKILQELRIGLVGLFLARYKAASIDLILTRTPGLDRVELFTSAVWVTLFSGDGESAEFPHTVRYPNTSVLYRMQASECALARESPHVERYELNRNTTEVQFRALYEKITGRTVPDDRWASLRREYQEFEDGFRAAAGMEGEKGAGIGQDSP